MNEADVVSSLVEFNNIILAGISVFFTVVSAYIAALNYFVRGGPLSARLLSFSFVTVIIGMIAIVLQTAVKLHAGLIGRLKELQALGELTYAGKAALANTTESAIVVGGMEMSLNVAVRNSLWAVLILTFVALFALTFVLRWGDDVGEPEKKQK